VWFDLEEKVLTVMLDVLDLIVLVGAGTFAALIGSVTGGGVTVILLPVLVLRFGIYKAMPIITIALFAASASRVAAYRRGIALPVVAWFSLGSVPLAAAGSYLFTVSAPDILTRLLGLFLVVMVIVRRVRPKPPAAFPVVWFLPLGAAFGFLTGISAAVATILAPFLLGFGLRKGGYVGTLGLNVFVIQIVKLFVFGGRDFLHTPVLIHGALLTPCMILGTLLGKQLLDRLSERLFVFVIEAIMTLAGWYFFLWGTG
jgi:uncharacterized membrane protein YfcA